MVKAQQADQPERDDNTAPHDREAQMHYIHLLVHGAIMPPLRRLA